MPNNRLLHNEPERSTRPGIFLSGMGYHNPMIEKRCTGCGEVKPLTEYNRDARRKDGRQSRCNACRAAYRASPEVKARESLYEAARSQRPGRKAKAAAYRASPEGIAYFAAYRERPENRAKMNAHGAAYREEHKEELLAYAKTPRGRAVQAAARARRRGLPGGQALTAEVMQEIQATAGGFCAYCNQHFTDGHVDHIQPVNRQGTNDADNLVYVCGFCNQSKGDKTLLEFLLSPRTRQ